MTRILVTGALGNVGSAVAQSLVGKGPEVVVADRSLEALEERFADSCSVARLDFHDHNTFDCLEGASGVFLLRPPQIARVGNTINPFIDHAVQSGIDHIVFSSVAGAESNRVVPHHRIEQHLSASGVGWTILRPGFFTQNLETAYRTDIVEDDRIFVPAGEGRVAFVDTRDIGEVAAVALTEPSHRGMAYHLTGPEAIDFHRIAEILTHALSREISYEPAGIPSYLTHLITRGLTPPHAIVQTILHAGLRRGDAAPVTDTIERLLGRQPRGVEEYVLDRARLFWKRPGI